MSERLWFYIVGGQQMGPLPEPALVALFQQAGLAPDTLVWAEGMAAWAPAHQVGLGPGAAVAAAAMAEAPPAAAPGAGGAAAAGAGGAAAAGAGGAAAGFGGAAAAGAGGAAAGFGGAGLLSPSETVLFHGALFGRTGTRADSFPLPVDGVKVSDRALATAMLTVVALVHEQAGTIRLAPGTQKGLFGLGKKEIVNAEPTGRQVGWQPGSLEERFGRCLGQGPQRVADLFAAVLAVDTGNPAVQVLHLAFTGLFERGLMGQETKKTLGIFKTQAWAMNDAGRSAMGAQSPAAVQQLLAETERARPGLTNLLADAVAAAIKLRTEVDNDWDAPDND